MYILLNFSRKIDCFNLYINCLNPLIKTNELAYIDLTSEIENINMDFVDIRQKVEASLSNASASIYNIIVLYDFEMQKKEPIVYSIAGMLNNIHDQIINPMKTNYAVEMIYFVALDDIGRGNNGEIVDVNLKKSLEFDRKGYIDEPVVGHFVSINDIEFIDKGFREIINKYQSKDGKIDIDNAVSEFCKNYLEEVEGRVVNALQNDILINDEWYEKSIKAAFKGYKEELKDFFNQVNKSEKNVTDITFSIRDYLKDNIASFTNIQQNKIFRLNMLDKKGHSRRDEVLFRNYYKIMAFIIYLVTEDKKYIFGGSFIKKENHYYVDVDIDDKVIENMLSDYNNNINYEKEKLGNVKFNEIEVEDFEQSKIESGVIDKNKYKIIKNKFSLLYNDIDLIHTKMVVEHWKNRYLDQVNHCNKRLRNISDTLRIRMLKDFTGKKRQVTVNELYQILNDSEEKIKELKDTLSKNTPEDIIQLDYSIFDENEKYMTRANKALNQRITIKHLLFNSLIILFISIIIFPLFRRFNDGFALGLIKHFIWVSPLITYLIIQFIYCFFKVREANTNMLLVENYTMKKINEINIDDSKFSVYINNIYGLMLYTKYVNKLRKSAENSQDDIDNYMYHKEKLEKTIRDNSKLARFMRFNLVIDNKPLKNILLDMNSDEISNDLYCPLLYAENNNNNYIFVNSSHRENFTHKLLNFVNTITVSYDEVYNEWS